MQVLIPLLVYVPIQVLTCMLALGVAPVQLRRMVRDTLGIGLETSTMASTAAVLSQRQYAMQLPSGLATETIKFVDSQTRCYLAHPRGGVGLGHHSSYAFLYSLMWLSVT